MSKRIADLIVIGVGMIASVAVVCWALWGVPPSADKQPMPRGLVSTALAPVRDPGLAARRQQARERAIHWLDQADRDAHQAAITQVETVGAFFQAAQQNTPALADEVLSWSGHWRFLADHVPGAGTGRHAAFLDAAVA